MNAWMSEHIYQGCVTHSRMEKNRLKLNCRQRIDKIFWEFMLKNSHLLNNLPKNIARIQTKRKVLGAKRVTDGEKILSSALVAKF